jgi:pimeloyl-ACP methyl ester carboxylesterase
MRPVELRAIGELAGEAVGGMAARVEDMHTGIAERVFGRMGVEATPVQVVHDRIARGVYQGVRRALGAAARAGAEALSVASLPDDPSLETKPAGRIAIGVLNGAFGDRLEETRSPLALPMTVRRGGRNVQPSRPALAQAFPDATGRLTVFIHGLCETDDAWLRGARRHPPYGVRLEAELGYTSVYVRYNSGRHISANGRDLARLLDVLVSEWPVDVSELVLIGHSMGGLVARSACHLGAGQPWVMKVRHVFMLGCPHRGAPLERAANAASVGLAALPETRGFAKALNLRSAGVKDLRYGYLLDEDWLDIDPDKFVRRAAQEVPFLRSANHYFVSASISRNPDGLSGRLFGDLLVVSASAWNQAGRGQRLTFPVDHYRHVGGVNHFDLVNHPAIYEQIRTWLAGRPALPAARPALPAARPAPASV